MYNKPLHTEVHENINRRWEDGKKGVSVITLYHKRKEERAENIADQVTGTIKKTPPCKKLLPSPRNNPDSMLSEQATESRGVCRGNSRRAIVLRPSRMRCNSSVAGRPVEKEKGVSQFG
jgi:hypothetical protein